MKSNMSDLETPRDRDDDEPNLGWWGTEIESLLSEFGEIALCYSWLRSVARTLGGHRTTV